MYYLSWLVVGLVIILIVEYGFHGKEMFQCRIGRFFAALFTAGIVFSLASKYLRP